MGLFNTIKDFKIQCPNCHEWVSGFQTKDFQDMGFSGVDEVNNFYSGCGNCGAWIEFDRKRPQLEAMDPLAYTRENFTIKVELGEYPTQEL